MSSGSLKVLVKVLLLCNFLTVLLLLTKTETLKNIF